MGCSGRIGAITGIKSSERGIATEEAAADGGEGWPIAGTKSGVVAALLDSGAECWVLEDTDERGLEVDESEATGSAPTSGGK